MSTANTKIYTLSLHDALPISKQQIKRFDDFCKLVNEAGIHIPIWHMANSAGIIELPCAEYDMVRCGIATYGIYPSEEVDRSEEHTSELQSRPHLVCRLLLERK